MLLVQMDLQLHHPSNPPPLSTTTVQSITSTDIKNNLTVGQYNHLRIQTKNSALDYNTQWKEAYKQTGLCMATLTVIGNKK